MIQSFKGQGTEDLFAGRNSNAARKACPPQLWRIAGRKLDQLNQAEVLGDPEAPPGNRLKN